MLIALLVPLGLAILVYTFTLARAAIARRIQPSFEALGLGAIVSFFDTLGIGSFAPTTAWLKFRGLVPDRLIVAAGLALATTAYAMANLDLFPGGGSATGLPFGLTIVAIVASFGFGLLANFGVGNYAPMLAMLSLMGMDPRLCFPIMAAGGSLMGAGASARHIAIGEIDLRVVLGLAIGGIPAVLVAAVIVKSMPVEPLRWLVIAVVVYTSAIMFRAAVLGRRDEKTQATASAVAVS